MVEFEPAASSTRGRHNPETTQPSRPSWSEVPYATFCAFTSYQPPPHSVIIRSNCPGRRLKVLVGVLRLELVSDR